GGSVLRKLIVGIIIGTLVGTLSLSPAMAQTGTAVEQSHTVLTTPRFTLTPTENMWNFLLLDTATGRVWQVQYSVSKDIPKTTYSINTVSLISSSEPLIPGRFTLIPTKNVWNFLLLD